MAPERMPADVLGDLRPGRGRTNVPLQQRIRTVGLLPLLPRAGEDPVVRLVVGSGELPRQQFLGDHGSSGTGFREISVLHRPTLCR